MKIMNVKFPVWIKYKKGFYSLFRLVMDFGCYYCHVLRDSFSDVVKHFSSVHEFDKLKIRSRELNVITGKIGYRTHNFNIILNEIKVNCFVFHVLIGICLVYIYSISLHFLLAILFIFQGP